MMVGAKFNCDSSCFSLIFELGIICFVFLAFTLIFLCIVCALPGGGLLDMSL